MDKSKSLKIVNIAAVIVFCIATLVITVALLKRPDKEAEGAQTWGKGEIVRMTYNEADGWYYTENGYVNENYTGVAHGEYGWWYVKNGKVDFDYTGLAGNDNGIWYIKDGKVDLTYNGFAADNTGIWCTGTWYVKAGLVRWDVDGIITDKDSSWLVEGGRIKEEFSGEIEIDSVKYKITNGKAEKIK